MKSTVEGQSMPSALIHLLGLPREHLSLYSCWLSSQATPPTLAFWSLQITWDTGLSLCSCPCGPVLHKIPPPSSPQLPHLNGKVDEATDAE